MPHDLTLWPPQETFLAWPLLALLTGGRFGEESANALFLYVSHTAFNPLASFGLHSIKMRGTGGDQLTSELKGASHLVLWGYNIGQISW